MIKADARKLKVKYGTVTDGFEELNRLFNISKSLVNRTNNDIKRLHELSTAIATMNDEKMMTANAAGRMKLNLNGSKNGSGNGSGHHSHCHFSKERPYDCLKTEEEKTMQRKHLQQRGSAA